MRMARNLPCFATALLATAAAAQAAPLAIVNVTAPDINCVFETDCTIVVTDSVGAIALPALVSGTPRLQSRTFEGKPGAPAAGKTGYEYRVDLTTAVTNAEFSCVTGLEIDFGPVTKLQYDKIGRPEDVFVVTKGGLGTIGLASAEQTGNVITFTFSQPVCAVSNWADPPGAKGQTTFFFGLTSAFPPRAVTATVDAPGVDPPIDVKARAPSHRP